MCGGGRWVEGGRGGGGVDREKSKFRRYWYVKWFSNLISKMVLGRQSPCFVLFLFTKYLLKKKNKNKLDSWTNNTYEKSRCRVVCG